jgi:dihydroorotate dehydrogenase (NAD+) catalytic subunit
VGGGGIMNARDALEYLLVGARAVQVGTANFVDPMTCINIINGIEDYFNKNGIAGLDDWVGKLDIT